MATLVLYKFRVRDAITGKWRETRYALTDDEARDRHGDGNYERIDASREVRTGDPSRQSASHLMSSPSIKPSED